MHSADAMVGLAWEELDRAARARVGTTLGDWTLEAVIDIGIERAIYAAQSARGPGAVHVLHSDLAVQPKLRQRFVEDVRRASTISHEHAIVARELGAAADGVPYFATQTIVGATLESLLRRRAGVMPVNQLLGCLEMALDVLEHAHASDVTHADVRPRNILLTNEQKIKVFDFGMARVREGAASIRFPSGIAPDGPGYLAPEQALGGAEAATRASDQFSVAAIAFAFVTGALPHAGRTLEEVLANASKSARSLGELDVDAPEILVELLDRALSFNPSARFGSATEFRVAMSSARATAEVRAMVVSNPELEHAGSQAPPKSLTPPSIRQAVPSAAFGLAAEARTAPPASRPMSQRGQDVAGFEVPEATPERVAVARDLFTQFDRALLAQRQYGTDHPEWHRRFDQVCDVIVKQIEETEENVAWNVGPFGFLIGEEPVWEPKGMLQNVPFELFADGVRMIAILPGITRDELARLVRLLTLDVGDLAQEDDLVTAFWDAGFEHVLYQAVDMFVEGDQETQRAFVEQRQSIIAFAHADSRSEAQASWTGHRGGQSAVSPGIEALRVWSNESSGDAGGARDVDASALAGMAARIESEAEVAPDRITAVASLAFVDAGRGGDASIVTTPIRTGLGQLAATEPDLCLKILAGFTRALEKRGLGASAVTALVEEVASEEIVRAVLGRNPSSEDRGEKLRALAFVSLLGPSHVPGAIDALSHIRDSDLRAQVAALIGRHGAGYESKLGALLVDANAELGAMIIGLLRDMATPEAQRVLADAMHSSDGAVRISALGAVSDTSDVRVTSELKALLDDADPKVRFAALETIEQRELRPAGPLLAMRIKSDTFDHLDDEEKRRLLRALSVLAPARAETLCIELLEGGLVTSKARDRTRTVAAEMLAGFATSRAALDALTSEANKRFTNSQQVRDAASRAATAVRTSLRPPAGKKS